MHITSTPWGNPQHVAEIAAGILQVSTASHGGLWLSAERLQSVPERWRRYAAKWSGSEHWFEEDCAAFGVILTFPELFPDVDPEAARRCEAWLVARGSLEGAAAAA